MNLLHQLFGKLSLSTLLIFLAGLFGYRASSNKHQRKQAEETAHEYEAVIQDVEEARNISDAVDAMPDDAVSSELHRNDWYRD